MDEIMDTKVVQMKFDNSQFRAGVQDTIRQLSQLEDSLELRGASNGLDKVSKASKATTSAMSSMAESVQTVQIAFSYLQVAGITAMVKLTDAALTYGKRIANNLWSKTMGQIISGGKRRSQNISNAKFQLEGLGVAWNEVYDDINYGVQDTAYGLDEAAAAAAQLVASQVQLGNEMKTALRGISGTAAMTNSSFSEISNIWTTVASNGKLMTMQLRQLSARGLNASAVLAKAMDKTEAEINDMVTKGKIDFREFAAAMDDAFGEHAKEANKTFQGAMSNMNAALSRIGAKFADPVFENLRIVFNALKGDINNINSALTPVVDLFTNIVNKIGHIGDAILSNENFIKGINALVIDLYSYIRPIAGAIHEMLPAGFDIGGFSRGFEDFAKSLQLYGDKAIMVKDTIKDIISAIELVFYGIKDSFIILKPFVDVILKMLGVPLDKLKEVPGMLYANKEAIKDLMDRIARFIALELSKVIDSIWKSIKAIDWKVVIAALVIVINLVSRAIVELPRLINVVKAIFGGVIAFIFIAAAAVTEFIDLVVQGWYALLGLANGAFSLFSSKPIVMEVSASMTGVDSASANSNNAISEVQETADEATQSVEELNDAVEEIPERLDVAGKNASRPSREIRDEFEETAETAEETADRVEEATDRMMDAPSKSASRPNRFPFRVPSPEEDENGKGIESNSEKSNGNPQDMDPTIHTLMERRQSGFKSFFEEFHDRMEEIKSDKSGQEATVSALDIWFGGITSAIGATASKWAPIISLALASIIPIVFMVSATINFAKAGMFIYKTLTSVVDLFFAAIQGLKDIFLSIGSITKSIRKYAVAAELRAAAEVLKSLVGPIIAIAITVGVVVGAAYLINRYNLEDTAKYIMAFVVGFTVVLSALVAAASLRSAAKSILKSVELLPNIIGQIGSIFNSLNKPAKVFQAQDTMTSIFKAMAEFFFALAANLVILAVSVKILGEMKPGELVQGMIAVGAFIIILGLLTVMMSKLAKSFQEYSFSYSEIKASISKGAGLNDKGVERSGNSLYKALLAIAGTLAVMTAAVVILGKQDPETLWQGMGAVVLSIGALAGFFALLLTLTGKYEMAKDGKRVSKTVERNAVDDTTMKTIVKFISAMAGYMLAISAVVKSAENMDPGQLLSVAGILALSLGALTGLMAVIAWNARQTKDVDTNSLEKSYSGMMKTILSVSVFLLAIGGYMKLIENIEIGTLWNGFGLMVASLLALTGFIAILVNTLSKADQRSALEAAARALAIMSIGLSAILLSVAVMFKMLDDVDWSAMSGSAGYLIGVGMFIMYMTLLTSILASFSKGNVGGVIAASIGIFGGIAVLLFSISKVLEVISAIDWSSMNGFTVAVLGIIAGIILTVGVITTIIAAMGPASLAAIGTLATMSLMFVSLGALFASIGVAVNLIGDGAIKISEALTILFDIDWYRAADVAGGLGLLLFSLSSAASILNISLLSGALILAAFAALISFALKQLTSIDSESLGNLSNTISTAINQLAQAISENEESITLLERVIMILPSLAQALASAVIILAVGGLGLIAFATELIIFGMLMTAGAEIITSGIDAFVQVLTDSGAIIAENANGVLLGFAMLFAVGTLAIVVGTLLLAGGILMAAAGGMICVAGIAIEAGVVLLATALSNAGDTIFGSIGKIITGFAALIVIGLSLTAFGGMLVMAGTSLLVGGIMFALGASMVLGGAIVFNKSSELISGSLLMLGFSTKQFVSDLQLTVMGLYSLAATSSGLGEAFAESAWMCVRGFVQGIYDGVPEAGHAIIVLAGSILGSFNGILGIHSPATEFINSAANCIRGFINGISENGGSAINVISNFGSMIYDAFHGEAVDPMDMAGQTSIGDFTEGFEGMLSRIAPDLMSDVEDYFGDLGHNGATSFHNQLMDGVYGALVAMDAALEGHGISDWSSEQRTTFANANGGRDGTHLTAAGIAQANAYNAQTYNAFLHSDEWVPVSRRGMNYDFIDPDQYYVPPSSGGGGTGLDTTSDIASAISGSSGSGSGINDASKGSAIGTGGSTVTNNNNTYNFVQNNYSPEPLQRSAIYQQTKQQFDGFYSYVKEKNLSY